MAFFLLLSLGLCKCLCVSRSLLLLLFASYYSLTLHSSVIVCVMFSVADMTSLGIVFVFAMLCVIMSGMLSLASLNLVPYTSNHITMPHHLWSNSFCHILAIFEQVVVLLFSFTF